MATDPFASGRDTARPMPTEQRLGDLEDSFDIVKTMVAKVVTTVERAYDVAEQGRTTAHELKEILANNSVRMRELERAVRNNSQEVGSMQATLISIDKTLAGLDRRVGKWPIEPDDRGSGLMGKVHAMGQQMGMSDARFSRSSYVDDAELLQAARDRAEEIVTQGWEITEARKEAERLIRQDELTRSMVKPNKSTMPPAVRDAWRRLPPAVQGVVITLATLFGLAMGAWQAFQAASGH